MLCKNIEKNRIILLGKGFDELVDRKNPLHEGAFILYLVI